MTDTLGMLLAGFDRNNFFHNQLVDVRTENDLKAFLNFDSLPDAVEAVVNSFTQKNEYINQYEPNCDGDEDVFVEIYVATKPLFLDQR